jgi:hypothetical protein
MEHTVKSVKVNISLGIMRRLLVTANVVPSLPILANLMMESLRSSETSFPTRRNIQEDGILHNHRPENLKSYISLIVFPVQNGLEERNASSPSLVNLALDCAIKKVQQNLVEVKFNEIYQLLS